ncbi:DUF4178 domain-containing protein [Flavobacterium phycosphaerae]|uniref:DUF4178 domain-containing protein n=1 Tax=Flavobacterium phycosphaerae TaxID=2697515 RepID=UPI0013897D3E|nr:DUF4178 domain-containing protein [Flavobacterium phycosphaerae]
MSFSCFNCDTVTDFEVAFEVKTFTCPSCQTVYLQNEGQFKFANRYQEAFRSTILALGSKATLKGKEYTLSGIIQKKAYGSFYWREYILHNEALEFLFLSEADGHWILLEEIEEEFEVDHHPMTVTYNGTYFDIYDYTTTEIVSASGYFDFDVTQKKIFTTEFINPPFMISVEKVDGVQTAFYGEHITKREIKKAFKVTNLPYKNGVGLVQPFIFNLKYLALTFCAVAMLILLSDWALNSERVEKEVLDVTIPFDSYNNKDFISPAFELKGSSAPMNITVSSNVDNSWANLQIALVNEKTGEETYANKDVEYYHGYTDGENWTEGSTSEDFNLCGVSQGKYHLVLTPMKAPEDVTNTDIYVKASWNKPSSRNVWMTIIFMGAFMALMYFINKYFETSRWEDSNYSPYNE